MDQPKPKKAKKGKGKGKKGKGKRGGKKPEKLGRGVSALLRYLEGSDTKISQSSGLRSAQPVSGVAGKAPEERRSALTLLGVPRSLRASAFENVMGVFQGAQSAAFGARQEAAMASSFAQQKAEQAVQLKRDLTEQQLETKRLQTKVERGDIRYEKAVQKQKERVIRLERELSRAQSALAGGGGGESSDFVPPRARSNPFSRANSMAASVASSSSPRAGGLNFAFMEGGSESDVEPVVLPQRGAGGGGSLPLYFGSPPERSNPELGDIALRGSSIDPGRLPLHEAFSTPSRQQVLNDIRDVRQRMEKMLSPPLQAPPSPTGFMDYRPSASAASEFIFSDYQPSPIQAESFPPGQYGVGVVEGGGGGIASQIYRARAPTGNPVIPDRPRRERKPAKLRIASSSSSGSSSEAVATGGGGASMRIPDIRKAIAAGGIRQSDIKFNLAGKGSRVAFGKAAPAILADVKEYTGKGIQGAELMSALKKKHSIFA
jgi:hypothetical protein